MFEPKFICKMTHWATNPREARRFWLYGGNDAELGKINQKIGNLYEFHAIK
jgi:hypothetical protein